MSSNRVPREVRITTQKHVGEQKKAIIFYVDSIATPVIRDECEKLGITPPRIEWVTSITVNGKEMRGAYQHSSRERRIIISHHTITQMLELNKPQMDIIARLIRVCFHEFKHYLDDKLYKLSMQEIKQDYWKYEDKANDYADELMKRV